MSPRIEESLPKYVQVANHLREQILSGELRPGDELPSERQLVDDWQVSRPTATRALAVLRVEGLVEARQGAGTFVRAQPAIYRRARDRYARSQATGRLYTSQEWSEILTAELVSASDEVATALGLEAGAPAICRRRVTHDQHGPVEVSTSWFDGALAEQAPRLLERSRITEGTLAYIEQVTSRRGATARDRHSVRLASEQEAAELGLGEGPAAVGLVHHTVYDTRGAPVEFAEAVYPPDRWTFEDEYPISR